MPALKAVAAELGKENLEAQVHIEGAEALDPDDEPFLRAENEDDDGYDPFSDRPAAPEPLFERDPWK